MAGISRGGAAAAAHDGASARRTGVRAAVPALSRRLLFLLLASLAVLIASASPALAATAWTGGGTASSSGGTHTLTTEVVRDGATNGPARFQYDYTDPDLNPGGAGQNATGEMFFETVSATTGDVVLDWNWTGLHAFFQVRAKLEYYVDTGSGPIYTTLIDAGPTDCCVEPSNGFAYTGRTVVSVSVGDTYGFRMTGSNGDFNATLQGLFSLGITVDTNAGGSVGTCDPAVPSDCSLRDAITLSNASVGSDEIGFGILGLGVQTIAPASALPQITDSVELDATTQDGFILGMGAQIQLDGSAAGSAHGFDLLADDSVIRGFAINGFTTATKGGIHIANGATGNLVAGNYIGTNAAGTVADANHRGVLVDGQSNTIGGPTAADRNVISGNMFDGVEIGPSNINATGNVVEGNYLGTNAAGTAAVANGGAGVSSNGVSNVTVRGNLVSGNGGGGINIRSNSLVVGNLVGLNAAGTAALSNGTGIFVNGSGTTIGGVGASDRNVVSGNSIVGINLGGAGGNFVYGNYVGIDPAGTTARANDVGVVVTAGTGNRIGGQAAGQGNVLSGNGTGVSLSGGSSTVVEGNLIGLSADGASAVGNTNWGGVQISGGAGALIGGPTSTPAARNVISGNTFRTGIEVTGGTGTQIQGNYIGTNTSGTAAIKNAIGIRTSASANGVLIGGVNQTNVISGNDTGVSLSGTGTGHQVVGNYIGVDATGSADLGNNGTGVFVGTSSNLIGSNVISGNGTYGLQLAASGNDVWVNRIGTDSGGIAAIGNSSHGVWITAANVLLGGSGSQGNVISGNGANGVLVEGANASLQGNRIGTNVNGTAALPNVNGVLVNQVNGTAVGAGTVAAGQPPGNQISGNTQHGVWVNVNAGQLTTIEGNLIGTNAAGTGALANGSSGVNVTASPVGSPTRVGGSIPQERNIISGNGQGIGIGAGAGAVIVGNYIGTDVNGTAALGNAGYGISIQATGNTVGGTTAAARNVISGNGFGVNLGAAGTDLFGNYIGLDATGNAALPNISGGVGIGVSVNADGAVVGGTDPGEGNVISGNVPVNPNNGRGVSIGAGMDNVRVEGNLIGTNAAGTAGISNGRGVDINGGTLAVIGGASAGARNVISGNLLGVAISNARLDGQRRPGQLHRHESRRDGVGAKHERRRQHPLGAEQHGRRLGSRRGQRHLRQRQHRHLHPAGERDRQRHPRQPDRPGGERPERPAERRARHRRRRRRGQQHDRRRRCRRAQHDHGQRPRRSSHR